ncbi:MAG: putative glycosyltransferase [Verrucomicrobiales bacterium]|jgi:uncharacterized protein
MKVLIDLQHPADLHFFRHLIQEFPAEGHTVKVTGWHKDILEELADEYGIEMEVFGQSGGGLFRMALALWVRMTRLIGIMRRFKPDLAMSIGGTFVSIPGRLMRVRTYVFYDTEHATVSNLLAYPFCSCVYVPQCYYKPIRWRHERYNGYHELAYMHPDVFTPDPTVLEEAGIGADEPFSIVRFVGWTAGHDLGHEGLTLEQKIRTVEEIARHTRVVISAEGDLPEALEPYRLKLPVTRMHHLMHYTRLIFGESGTMPSEASVRGVPSIYINPLRLGYLEEQEREYGLVSVFTPTQFEDALARALSILQGYDRDHWRALGERLVHEKIDVNAMLKNLVNDAPSRR